MRHQQTIIFTITILAFALPDIIVKEAFGFVPLWLFLLKIGFLLGAAIVFRYMGDLKNLSRYAFLLSFIVATQMFIVWLGGTSWWRAFFDTKQFTGSFGSNISLKLLGILPVIPLLVLMYRSRREIFLINGDLSVKASRIRWLGIEGNKISWGNLAIISGFLIAFGTLLLTLITVTGFSIPSTAKNLPGLIPFILVFALVNSFSEGIIYRNSILGPLKSILPKEQLLILAGLNFGIAHFYGAPSGLVGVIMSGVLGWYMCRSMVETQGFLSSLIIHFMQDVVIFTTIVLLGGW